MIFVVLFAVLAVAFWWLLSRSDSDAKAALAIGCTLLAVAMLTIWAVVYPGAIATYSKLTSYQLVDKLYVDAITQTANAVVVIPERSDSLDSATARLLKEFDIDVANFRHSSQTADRINDLKEMRKWYYQTLEQYRMLTSNFFTRSFLPPLPAALKGK